MRHLALVTLFLVTGIAAGCSGGSTPAGDTGAKTPAPATTSPATSAPAAVETLPAGLDDGARAADSPVDAALAAQGKELFSTKGCTACHAFGKKATGPDMAGVSKRRTAKWIEYQILHPDLMIKQDPIAKQLFAQFMLQMPKQGLTAEQARAVIEYFKQTDQ